MQNSQLDEWLHSLERLLIRRDPRRERTYMTRTAWLAAAVGTLFAVAAFAMGISLLVSGWGAQPLDEHPPVAAAPPTATAAPLARCAITWQFVPTTPVPGLGHIGTVDDPQVVERVQADYLAAWAWMYGTDQPWDIGQAEWFYQGAALDLVRSEVDRHLERGEFFRRDASSQTFTELYFTAASRVFFATVETKPSKLVFERQSGQEKERVPLGEMMVWQVVMVYDQAACRWKVVEMGEKPFKIVD